MKPIEERKPLTEEEVIAYLNEKVADTEERPRHFAMYICE